MNETPSMNIAKFILKIFLYLSLFSNLSFSISIENLYKILTSFTTINNNA